LIDKRVRFQGLLISGELSSFIRFISVFLRHCFVTPIPTVATLGLPVGKPATWGEF
jgi:hypothetical protein